ncbi:MAG: hypothetical protein JWR55_2860 [Aeromicrobium sp.]|nr:hypothetical protein [Aeromicrobium sp.]
MRRRRLAAAGVAGVVLLGGGGVAYAQTQGGVGSYRTAAASVGDVDETLTLSGTVTASTRQDLSFGASGTVTKVAVEAGDTVSAGDVLAKLDPTALQTAVTKARATLAKARAQLETDQTSQASTVTESTTPTTTPTTTSGDDGATPSSGSSGSSGDSANDSSGGSSGGTSSKTTAALKAALKKLAAQQSAVITAQTAATDAITAAKSALSKQADACAVEEAEEPAEPADGDDGEDDGGTDDAPASTGLSDACTTALADVQAAQDVVSQKQDTLQSALKDLSTTLTAAVKTVGEAGSTSGSTGSDSGSGSGSGSAGSGSAEEPAATESSTPAASSSSASSSDSSSGTAGGSSGGGGTVTAATLAQDQAAIDTAKAELIEGERARAAAHLTAPFSGEVLSVSAAKSDTVADSDVVLVLAGDGATTVTTTVTLDQIDDVEVGQAASVMPAGATEPASGTVTSIGLLPEGTDTTTYPVTIELDGEVAAPEGSTASIQLVIGTATDVVTVPSSAISTARRTTVTVLTDGQPVVTPVTVGVIGATRTAITEGVKDGQQVVLADLDAALPSGDSTTTSLTGGGGFPGGGAGGGRPGGAAGGRG